MTSEKLTLTPQTLTESQATCRRRGRLLQQIKGLNLLARRQSINIDITPLQQGEAYFIIVLNQGKPKHFDLMDLPLLCDKLVSAVLNATAKHEEQLTLQQRSVLKTLRVARNRMIKLDLNSFELNDSYSEAQRCIQAELEQLADKGSVIGKLNLLSDALVHYQQWMMLSRELLRAGNDLTHPNFDTCRKWLSASSYATWEDLREHIKQVATELAPSRLLVSMAEISGLPFSSDPNVLIKLPEHPHWSTLPNSLINAESLSPFLSETIVRESELTPFYFLETRVRWNVETFKTNYQMVRNDQTPFRLTCLSQVLTYAIRALSRKDGEVFTALLFNQEAGLLQLNEAEDAKAWALESKEVLSQLQASVYATLRKLYDLNKELDEIPYLARIMAPLEPLPDEDRLQEHMVRLRELADPESKEGRNSLAALLSEFPAVCEELDAFTHPGNINLHLGQVSRYEDPLQLESSFGNLKLQFRSWILRCFDHHAFFTFKEQSQNSEPYRHHSCYLPPSLFAIATELSENRNEHAIRQLDYRYLDAEVFQERYTAIADNGELALYQLAQLSNQLAKLPEGEALLEALKARAFTLASLLKTKSTWILRNSERLRKLQTGMSEHFRDLLFKMALRPMRLRFDAFSMSSLDLAPIQKRWDYLKNFVQEVSSADNAGFIRDRLETLELTILKTQARTQRMRHDAEQMSSTNSGKFVQHNINEVRQDLKRNFGVLAELHRLVWEQIKNISKLQAIISKETSDLERPVFVDHAFLQKCWRNFHFREGITLEAMRRFASMVRRRQNIMYHLEKPAEGPATPMTPGRHLALLLKKPWFLDLEMSYLRLSFAELSTHFVSQEGASPELHRLLAENLSIPGPRREAAKQLWAMLQAGLKPHLQESKNHPFNRAYDLFTFETGKLLEQ